MQKDFDEFQEVTNKLKKDSEQNFKNKLFDRILTSSEHVSKILSQIDILRKNVDLENDLPNIQITFNNKLVELSHIFKKSGLSMYSNGTDDIAPSFLGSAIISDLLGTSINASDSLKSHQKVATVLCTEKVERAKALEAASPLKRFIMGVKNGFRFESTLEILTFSEEETALINSPLLDYKNFDTEISNYNLQDNLVPSLVNEIRSRGYQAFLVPDLLEERINPDLEKLGLTNLIPELQEKLIEEYKKDLPSAEIGQVNKNALYLYVPDFTQNPVPTDSNTKINLKTFCRINDENNKTISYIEKFLDKKGISLEDISKIDSTVTPEDRQSATNAIKNEFQQAQENNKENDISLDK